MQREDSDGTSEQAENGAAGEATTWTGRRSPERSEVGESTLVAKFNVRFAEYFDFSRARDPLRITLLFSSEPFVKTCLPAIRRVPVNDPTFCRFVDSRNRRPKLFDCALWR
jgi:hypothetical protein